jgi:hypothetical protein
MEFLKMRVLLFLILFLIGSVVSNAQTQDYQIGVNPMTRQSLGGFYDYSDPTGLNIKVSVWGYVRFPGRYVIPVNSNVRDLLSLAGGTNESALLDEMKIHRVYDDQRQELLPLDYKGLFEDTKLTRNVDLSSLRAGDVLIVPGRKMLYWEDYFTIVLSGVGFLVTVATFIITLSR